MGWRSCLILYPIFCIIGQEMILEQSNFRKGHIMYRTNISLCDSVAVTITILLLFSVPAEPQSLPFVSSNLQIVSITGPSTSPTLKWKVLSSATGYEIQVSTDRNFLIGIVQDSLMTDTSCTLHTLIPNTGYYCRVIASAASGQIGWSEPTPFYAEAMEDVFTLSIRPGWNFISIPFNVSNSERQFLFPSPCPKTVFCYSGSYTCCPSYSPWERSGFWIKYYQTGTIGVTGIPLVKDTQTVNAGWNIIGTLFAPVAVQSVSSDPSSLLISHFFSYFGGRYVPADSLEPFQAYWVKAKESGTITLSLPPIPLSHIQVLVHWQQMGIKGTRIVLMETQDTVETDSNGRAQFTVPSGNYTLRAFGINRGGPISLYIDYPVVTLPGETTQVDIIDCLPCL